jgi:undecaprenyl-diphosphatase
LAINATRIRTSVVVFCAAVSAALPPDPGATRSLRRRLAEGPLARRIALIDLRLYRLLRSDLHEPRVARAVRVFSTTGEHAALWHGIGLCGQLVDHRRRAAWRRSMWTIGATQLANVALKQVARRSRPALEDLPALVRTPTQLSFPSAHSSSSFAAARAFSGLLPAGPLYATAAAMALSRVYLGVHYPTDITVGAALGLAIGSARR